jgi:hypothetical protein
MTEYEITAPTPRRGLLAGVPFVDGRATVTDPDPGALLYFQRHGYRIEQRDDGPPDKTPATAPDDGPQTPKPAGRSRSRKG